MSVYNVKTDFDKLRPLLTICKYLAIIPYTNKIKATKIYPIIWIIVLVGLYLYITLGKTFVIGFQRSGLSIVLTESAGDLVCFACNILAVALINIAKGDEVCGFFKKLRKFDRNFSNICAIKTSSKMFYAELIFLHIYFLAYYFTFFSIFVLVNQTKVFVYYFVKDLISYNIIILALLLRNCALTIKNRFENINKILHSILRVQDIGLFEKFGNYSNIKNINQLYTSLTDMVQTYNEIFGWQFVMIYIYIIVSLLTSLNVAIVYGSGHSKLFGMTFGPGLFCLCLFWASLPFTVAVLIFSACSRTTDEVTKTRSVCHVALKELVKLDKTLKDDLQELIQQTNDCPTFSAAGFFTINYGLLFSIIGSIGSYIVVLLQFRQ